jgi:hypothetical protein
VIVLAFGLGLLVGLLAGVTACHRREIARGLDGGLPPAVPYRFRPHPGEKPGDPRRP